ncbi:MAG: type 4a pilus biogenesis protein PilO [bacterium]|nr:type 4a pilus biogenesis protein PilO [bacterium]
MKTGYKTYYGKFAAVLLLIVFGLVCWLGLLPYVVNTVEKNQVRKELRQRISLVNNWEDRHSSLAQQNQVLTDAIQEMESSSLTIHQSHLITKKVFEYAQSLDIDIQRFEQGNMIVGENGSEQKIEIRLFTGYHQIAKFIQELENSEYYIAVQSFDLTRNDQSNQIEGSIIVLVKYRSEK